MLKQIFKKIINKLLIVTILFLCFVLSSCDYQNLSSNMNEIRLNEVTRSVFYCSQYVAIENHYFEEENIKVLLSIGNGGDKTMTSLISKQADIALVGPETVIYVHNERKKNANKPIIFAKLTNCDGSFIVGREEKFLWKNLENNTIISGRTGGLPEMCLSYAIKKNGVDGKLVKFINNIQLDLMAPAFCREVANYVTLFEPSVSILIDKFNAKIVASIGKEVGEIPYTCYVSTEDFIKKEPNLIQGFVNGIYKGEQWVENHTSQEIANLISPYFSSIEIDLLTKAIENYKNISAFAKTPIISLAQYKRLIEIIKESNPNSVKNLDMEVIINNSFSENAEINVNKIFAK